MSKLPEKNPCMPTTQQGLFDKFRVSRVDGQSAYGKRHHKCEYFVLDMDHDKFAKAAVLAYAAACEQEFPVLAADLRNRYG